MDIKESIKRCILSFPDRSLSESTISLFDTLGYNTQRQIQFHPHTYESFDELAKRSPKYSSFNPSNALAEDWKYIDIVFQLTTEDLSDIEGFDNKIIMQDNIIQHIESYLFIAIELKSDNYSRTKLAKATREINKLFAMPAMIVFRYSSFLTLSIINRRVSKRDSTRDVLEKVTLIKDINIQNPHRAHIEIINDLSLYQLRKKDKIENFVRLHEKWLETLDSKELNKKFYKELANWYFWATDKVYFPNDLNSDEDVHISESLIRLLTRLIFIWFIKEMGLVPDIFFQKQKVENLLIGFNSNNSAVYYRAILQNLFFATLNQKKEERKFAEDGTFSTNRAHYGIKNLYRYSSDFCIAKKDILALFSNVPFINGGLFDCLDISDEEEKVLYSDGFSRKKSKQAIVPDELFFCKEKKVDLRKDYGTEKPKMESVKGLFNIFNNYKFTVEENTPIEEEIALDPELLGRVFENLLASYNPETKKTARELTGSFYTPRPVVNYIVDEVLKAYLKKTLISNAHMDADEADIGLEFLLGYYEKENLFNENQTLILVNALDKCKILDPACGSGAFPMGILHKMVHVLKKLDPDSKRWKTQQTEKIQHMISKYKNMPDYDRRDKIIENLRQKIEEIDDLFKNNELDYGRKLYLIENCIYGVDIQPIAIQISKLRFLISLIIDQHMDSNKENLGVRPLPNLETKFVAANTLIGLDTTKKQGVLHGINSVDKEQIDILQQKREDIRHKMFSPRTSAEKYKLRREDEAVRIKLSSLLIKNNIDNITAQQMTTWNPYDQNTKSSFFDQKWMFGIDKGFDIVIGNPPYGNLLNKNEKIYIKKYYKHSTYSEIASPFLEKGIQLLKDGGIISYIITFAITFSKEFSRNRTHIYTSFHKTDIFSFDRDKCRIFENMSQTVSIIKCLYKNATTKKGIFTSRMFRETPELQYIQTSNADHYLLPESQIPYSEVHRLPKIGEKINIDILEKLLSCKKKIKNNLSVNPEINKKIWIRTSGNYWYNAWYTKPYESSKIIEIGIKHASSDFILLLPKNLL